MLARTVLVLSMVAAFMLMLPTASCIAKPSKTATAKASHANIALQEWFASQSKNVVLLDFETYPEDEAKIGLDWAKAQYAETADPETIKKIMKKLSKSGIHARHYRPEIDNVDDSDIGQPSIILTLTLKGQPADGEQIWLSLSPKSKSYTVEHTRGKQIPFHYADLKTLTPLIHTLRSLVVQAKHGSKQIKVLKHNTAS